MQTQEEEEGTRPVRVVRDIMRYYLNGRAKGYITEYWNDVGVHRARFNSLLEAKRYSIGLLSVNMTKSVTIHRYWDEDNWKDDSEWKVSGWVERAGRMYRYIAHNESYLMDKNGKRI